MSIFSLGLPTTITTIASSAMDLLAAASPSSPEIMEIHINLAAATVSTYGLGPAGNTPVQTSGVAVMQESPADGTSGLSKIAVAWGTAPTVPTNFFRRISLPGTIGVGVIWTFPKGLKVKAATAMELWNITANSASTNINWVVNE